MICPKCQESVAGSPETCPDCGWRLAPYESDADLLRSLATEGGERG